MYSRVYSKKFDLKYWKFKYNSRLSNARDQNSYFNLKLNASHIINEFDC